jgi:hypothetical protein
MKDFIYVKSLNKTCKLNDNFTETFNPIYDVIIATYQYKQ